MPENRRYTIAILLNPTVLIEVLSPSSNSRDRIVKLDEYTKIPSLQAYLMIDQDKPEVHMYSRGMGSDWIRTVVEGLNASIALPSLALTLTLADMYERVEFPPQNPTP
jgi:Uma2 family endonuclease